MSLIMNFLAYILVCFITIFLVQRVESIDERVEKLEGKYEVVD